MRLVVYRQQKPTPLRASKRRFLNGFVVYILTVLLSVAVSAEKLILVDFSKGMAKGIASTLTANGVALEIKNFDLHDPLGEITPRHGFYHIGYATDSLGANRPPSALITYQTPDGKRLLIKRAMYPASGYGMNNPFEMMGIAKSNSTDSLFPWYFYNQQSNLDIPQSGVTAVHWNKNLFIASAKSELMVFDGNNLWPARPYGPGQPKAIPIDTGGNVTGQFQYRYSYLDSGTAETNFSLPSFPVNVTDGKVALHGFARCHDSANFTWIKVYRDYLDDTLGYFHLATFAHNGDTTYLDAAAYTGTGNEPTYPWGYSSVCYSKLSNCTAPAGSTFVSTGPPGSPKVAVSYAISPHAADNLIDSLGPVELSTTQLICQSFEYVIVFVDSTGRWGYPSAGVCVRTTPSGAAATLDTVEIALTEIPIPGSHSKIIKKYLLRRNGLNYVAKDSIPDDPDVDDYFYLIDTMLNATTIYTDTISVPTSLGYPKFCFADEGQYYSQTGGNASFASYQPHLYDCADDSIIQFKPLDLLIKQTRMWAVGDPANPNRLYFSDYGKPTTWPNDKMIDIPSAQGDWFVRLHQIGESLILFRQNSITSLSGVNFYQFRVQNISTRVGATAPKSVAGDDQKVLFAHVDGIYLMQVGTLPMKISLPIQNYWDSLSINQVRNCYGTLKDNEYWLAHGKPSGSSITPDQIIIYNLEGQYWRLYDYGIDHMVQYSLDEDLLDFDPSRFVFLHNDSLFEFSDTTYGGADTGGLIISEWHSKVLFDQPGRQKINYIDFSGYKAIDSILIFSYRDNYYPVFQDNIYSMVDTVTIVPDWTSAYASALSVKQVRARLGYICKNVQFKIKFYSSGPGVSDRFRLRTMEVDYTPWDEGRP